MRRFELLEPTSVADAIAALDADPAARPIAGGTALLILIKHGVFLPGTLVSLRKIPGAAEIADDGAGGLRIGALASIREVERHPLVRERYPVLVESCHVVANIRIRNLATIGGNLAHADYQSDPPGTLAALGARVELTGPDGSRELALDAFLRGPYETSLAPAELLAAVRLPAPEPGWRGAYLKFTTRSSEDRPTVGATALVRIVDGRCVESRLVVGAVTGTPVRLTDAEALLQGEVLDAGRIARVAPLVEAAVDATDDLRGSAAYKRRVAGAIVERALERAIAGTVPGGAAA